MNRLAPDAPPLDVAAFSGIQTDLQSRALDSQGAPIDGLYAAGEVAGFGGGGV